MCVEFSVHENPSSQYVLEHIQKGACAVDHSMRASVLLASVSLLQLSVSVSLAWPAVLNNFIHLER